MAGAYGFLDGGGDITAAFEKCDWSKTPLGSIETWPSSLTTTISIMLRASLPMSLLWGEQGILLYNNAYAGVAGQYHPEILGKPVSETWPETAEFHENVLREGLEGKTLSYERQELTLHRNGVAEQVFMDLNYSPIMSEAGSPAGVLGIIIESTQIVLADRKLRAETQMLETLNRTGAALAAELDLETLVQMVTDAGVGLTRAQFGAYFHNIMDESGERLHLFTLSGAEYAAFESLGRPRATAIFGPTFRNEGVIRSDDIVIDPRYGHNAPFAGMPPGHLPVRSYLAVPVASRSGEVLGGLLFGHPEPGQFSERHENLILGVAAQAAVAIDNARLFKTVQDINETLEVRVAQRTEELTQANEALRQAQKMEALGQLTGGLAHDFNNLLTVIRGSSDLLKRPGLTDERRVRYIDAISDTADRATKLTSQLLAFARRSSLTPTLLDVGSTIRGLDEMMAMLAGSFIELDLRLPGDVCHVNVDASQFETAIVNMALNARDAMDQRGTLIISVERATQIPTVRGHSVREGHYVAVSITDSGCGIPPENLDHIFEPFFTTKAVGHGTGLGLSQVFGFAKQSGGDIIASSQLGEGATLTLYLPCAEGAVEPAPEPIDDDLMEARPARILIVEDNEDVGAFAAAALQDLGHDCVRARDAQEALLILSEGGAIFDIIFTDVMMPGMNGIDFAREVRRASPKMPILLTSGYSEILSTQGAQGFELLRKPYSVDELARAMQKVILAEVQN